MNTTESSALRAPFLAMAMMVWRYGVGVGVVTLLITQYCPMLMIAKTQFAGLNGCSPHRLHRRLVTYSGLSNNSLGKWVGGPLTKEVRRGSFLLVTQTHGKDG